jgi:hypothetical protein
MWKKVSVAAVLFTASLALTAVLVWPAKSHPAPKSSTQTQPIQSQTRLPVPSQHVRFTVYPEGILPAAATVHQGLISIAIEDLADIPGGVLIERVEDGQRRLVGNVRRSERSWRGRATVDLSPGIYRLRIPSDKAKEAVITVVP